MAEPEATSAAVRAVPAASREPLRSRAWFGLQILADAVKREDLQAGGFPLEFPAMSLGELFRRPTSMLYPNLAAMETEERMRADPLDESSLNCSACHCMSMGTASTMACLTETLPA